MISLTIAELAALVDGTVAGDPTTLVTGAASLDSRTVEPRGLFVAISGEHVDGHDFAEAAVAAGAAAVLGSRPTAAPTVVVPDPVAALGRLARAVLDRPELRFVFGYEEALGYAVTDRVLDKDGISAAVVAARLIGSLRAAGSGVEEALATLAERHGLHATRTLHLRMDAADGSAAEVVARVLDVVPSSDDRRVLARASGTEAMAKVYLEVVEPLAGGSADHLVARYRAAASRADVILDQLEGAARACLAAG